MADPVILSDLTIPKQLPAAQSGTVTGVIQNYNPLPAQEKARSNIAYLLLATLIAIIIITVLVGLVLIENCYVGKTCAEAKDTMALLVQLTSITFTPIVGLVGSVVGFYFGAKSANGN